MVLFILFYLFSSNAHSGALQIDFILNFIPLKVELFKEKKEERRIMKQEGGGRGEGGRRRGEKKET